MSKKIVFITDIDGTLIKDGNSLCIEDKKHLKKIRDKCYKIIFATGRNYKKLLEVIGNVDFEYDAICCNGAEVYDNLGQLEYYSVIKKRYVSNILNYLEKEDVLYLIYTKNEIFVRGTTNKNQRLIKLGETIDGNFEDVIEEAKIYYNLIYKNTTEVFNLKTTDLLVSKIEIIDPDVMLLDKIKSEVLNNYDVTALSSFRYNLEITPINNNKATALDKIINADDVYTIVAGDGMNDISLFNKCDYAIAMPNSDSVLLQNATVQLKNNESLLDKVEEVMNENK